MSRPKLVLFVAILMVQWVGLATPRANAQGGWIGFAQSSHDDQVCYLPYASPGTMHIVASAPYGEGLIGAAFSVENFPTDDYFVIATPNPEAAVALGNPFDDAGAIITFATCQTAQTVSLYTLTVIRITENPAPFVARIAAASIDPYTNYSCAKILLCDAPTFSPQCVRRGETARGPITPVPSNPVPADGAMNISINPSCSAVYEGRFFCCGLAHAYPWKAIYFGTDPDPPLVEGAYPGTPPTPGSPYRPGVLQPDTRYYWRVAYSPWNACGLESSPVWSFKTGESVAVEQAGWGMVKRRYRE